MSAIDTMRTANNAHFHLNLLYFFPFFHLLLLVLLLLLIIILLLLLLLLRWPAKQKKNDPFWV